MYLNLTYYSGYVKINSASFLEGKAFTVGLSYFLIAPGWLDYFIFYVDL